MSKKFYTTESLWYKCVATALGLGCIAAFSSGGETTGRSFQLSLIIQKYVLRDGNLRPCPASELVLSMAGHVVNSRRVHLKSSSMNDILFLNS